MLKVEVAGGQRLQKYAGTIYATAGGDISFATLNNTFILWYQGFHSLFLF